MYFAFTGHPLSQNLTFIAEGSRDAVSETSETSVDFEEFALQVFINRSVQSDRIEILAWTWHDWTIVWFW